MITMLEIAPSVLAYHVDGKVDAADVERVFEKLDKTLASGDLIRVYAEVHSLAGMSLEGVWTDLRLGTSHMTTLRRITKAALVTDIEWIRRAANLQGLLPVGPEIRIFSLAEQAEARRWIQS